MDDSQWPFFQFSIFNSSIFNVIVMDYQAIIDEYYPEDDELRGLLLKHSRQVADRCLQIANKHRELPLDVQFLEEADTLIILLFTEIRRAGGSSGAVYRPDRS